MNMSSTVEIERKWGTEDEWEWRWKKHIDMERKWKIIHSNDTQTGKKRSESEWRWSWYENELMTVRHEVEYAVIWQ